jgi:hypothetical protein
MNYGTTFARGGPVEGGGAGGFACAEPSEDCRARLFGEGVSDEEVGVLTFSRLVDIHCRADVHMTKQFLLHLDIHGGSLI